MLLRSAAESVGARACVHARCGSISLHSTVSYHDRLSAACTPMRPRF
jgi:hypothetical protein